MMDEQHKRLIFIEKKVLADIPTADSPGAQGREGLRGLWGGVVALVEEAHADQFRNNGRPYLAHVLDVAEILAEWNVEPLIVMGGLLHDVVRYGRFSSVDEVASRLAQLGSPLGEASLDSMVEQASLLSIAKDLAQADLCSLLQLTTNLGAHDWVDGRDSGGLQEIFDLMVVPRHAGVAPRHAGVAHNGVRAVLILCADRLANLRDLGAFKGSQREGLLLNTEEVYLPLLDRLGMWQVRVEVEELLFEARSPERYALIRRWQAQQRAGEGNAEAQPEALLAWRVGLQEALSRHVRSSVRVEITYRSAASTWRRHLADLPRNVDDLSQLDGRHLFVTTVLLSAVDEAYLGLAGVHECGTPSMASFRDYFAQPKASGYAALHTTVIVNSKPYCVHLHTRNLHGLAKQGILLPAAYDCWQSGVLPADWAPAELRALTRFMASLRNRKPDRLALLTPKGDVIELRQGATVLDFAYAIHTDVGRQTGTAFVNEVQVPLNMVLHSGDVVEIRKDLAREWPEPAWLNWVRSSKAQNAIQMQLRQRPQIRGRTLIDKGLRQRGYKLSDYESRLTILSAEMDKTAEEIFIAVAEGLPARQIVDRLLFLTKPQRTTFYRVQLTPESAARFPQWHDEMIVAVECCSPAPGTPIVGYHSQKGIELHRADCPRFRRLQGGGGTSNSRKKIHSKAQNDKGCGVRADEAPNDERLVTLCWQTERVEAKLVKFTLRAVTRRGLINDLTHVLRQANVEIVYLEGKRQGEMDEINFTLEVTNELELGYLLNTIRRLPNVNGVLVDGQEADAASHALRPYLAPPQPIISPFSPGRPVSGAGHFWGRATEVQTIESLLNGQKPPSLLVQGPRRIGKTSLLKHLGDLPAIRKKYRYVYVDLQSVAYSNTSSVLRLIARHLGRTLRRLQSSDKSAKQIPVPSMEKLRNAPQETFLGYLAELTDTSRYVQKRILLALDEFGTLVESVRANSLDAGIFHLLRSVMQHNPLVTMMLCTSDNVAELLAEEGVLDLLNVTTTVRLGHLDKVAAQQLIQEPLRGQLYFEPEAISSLLRVTDHHPYYLQILGSNLITQLNHQQRRNVYQSDIESLVRHQINLNGSEFMHLWERQNNICCAVLQALCAPPAASAISPYGPSIIQRRLHHANTPLSLEPITQTLERLTHMDTLTRHPHPDGSTRYHVRVELFREWFAAHHPLLLKN